MKIVRLDRSEMPGGVGNAGSDDFSWFGSGGESGKIHDKDFIGGSLDKVNPYVKAGNAQREKEKRDRERLDELVRGTGEINTKLGAADVGYLNQYNTAKDAYLSGMGGLVDAYTGKIQGLSRQAENQAKSAEATYSNDILPGYKEAMEQARTNARQAMTLAEAGDPNNPIMKSIRAMYDEQAQGARKQGQQDFGVLSALGAQAAQGQFGAAGPMTAGQMGQIYGANQAQAGDAYARAQQRMYDLQQQGIDRGFDQSNRMYEYGQAAQDRFSRTLGDMEGGQANYQGLMQGYRGEIGDYAGDILGARGGLESDRFNMGMMGADIEKGNAYAGAGREQGLLNTRLGGAGALDANETNRKVAGREKEADTLWKIGSMFAGGAGGAGAAGGAGGMGGFLSQLFGRRNSQGYQPRSNTGAYSGNQSQGVDYSGYA